MVFMVTGLFACLHIPLKVGSSSLLVKISYFVLIRKIVMFKNWLIFTGIFIEMGVIEIEYEFNKINVFTKSDEEPHIPGIGGTMATGLSTIEPNACCKLALCPPSLSSRCISVLFLSFIYSCFCLYCLCVGCFKNFIGKGFKKILRVANMKALLQFMVCSLACVNCKCAYTYGLALFYHILKFRQKS